MIGKRIVVIGSGISGLSAAYRLGKLFPHDTVTVLEKEARAGGWIQSLEKEGFFFEMGPRVFKGSKSLSLLSLIEELGLQEKVKISTNPKRYIVENGSLRSLPSGPLSFVFSPFFFPLVKSLIREITVKPLATQDESIADFIGRRFGKYVLAKLFDPLVQGIYAQDPHHLSILSCFGYLKRMEDCYGSVVRGVWIERSQRQAEKKRNPIGPRLFSLDGGVERLIDVLIQQGRFSLHYHQHISSIKKEKCSYVIHTKDSHLEADAIFIATDPQTAASIISASAPSASALLGSIHSTSITSVCIGFHTRVLTKVGFGYLVPTKERSPILGCVMDSEIFTDPKGQTRLTLMLKGVGYSQEKIHEHVLYALRNHLQIEKKPDYLHVITSKGCIPQMAVGHKERVLLAQSELKQDMPQCFLIGSYVNGVSVSDCIDTAAKAVDLFYG